MRASHVLVGSETMKPSSSRLYAARRRRQSLGQFEGPGTVSRIVVGLAIPDRGGPTR
jgi:hypothetical protein